MARGEGTTTQQMEKAPKGAVFVWCNGKTDYPRLLARKIGREDLQIQPPAWLEDAYCWRGLELPGVVVDHAARLTDRQWDGFQEALTRVRSNAELWGAPPTGGASHTNAVLGAAVPPAPTFDKGENDERD